MIAFIDDHRGAHGVEPICKILPIAPSTRPTTPMWPSGAIRPSCRRAPGRMPKLKSKVRRVFDENFRVYGVRKVWRQLKREGFDVARYTVSRLMRDMGLRGVIRRQIHQNHDQRRPRHARWITSIASSRR
jgi:putative transposase